MEETETSPVAPAAPQLTLGVGQFRLHAYKIVGGTIYFVPLVTGEDLKERPDAEVSAVPLITCLLSGICGDELRPRVVDTMLAERKAAFEAWDDLQALNELHDEAE